MSNLSAAELKTLNVIADPSCSDRIARNHLEKLSRLDLIEPTTCGVVLSLKGKEYLFNKGKH